MRRKTQPLLSRSTTAGLRAAPTPRLCPPWPRGERCRRHGALLKVPACSCLKGFHCPCHVKTAMQTGEVPASPSWPAGRPCEGRGRRGRGHGLRRWRWATRNLPETAGVPCKIRLSLLLGSETQAGHRPVTGQPRGQVQPPGPPSTQDTWQRLGTFPMSQPGGTPTGLW